jgi:hypothetical protein
MGLVDKGDKYGAVMYPASGAADHYLSWDTKTQIQKDDLLEKFKVEMAEVCVFVVLVVCIHSLSSPCSLHTQSQ